MNDSDSGEDDTARYFVNEKPPSFGRATHQRSQISCLVLGLAGGMGREGCGWGRRVRHRGPALPGLPGEAVLAVWPRAHGGVGWEGGSQWREGREVRGGLLFYPPVHLSKANLTWTLKPAFKKVNKAGLFFFSFEVFVAVW